MTSPIRPANSRQNQKHRPADEALPNLRKSDERSDPPPSDRLGSSPPDPWPLGLLGV